MPSGFASISEAQLHGAAEILPDAGVRDSLLSWWLAVRGNAKTTTPNWDVASTCTVGDAPGIILIEAKAHDAELRNEERGKPLIGEENRGVSFASRRNHVRIGASIQEAGIALAAYTGLPWALSRDWNYQMSNRFAWAFKVAELGIPVILIYLAFTGCEEMRQGKTAQRPIVDSDDWRDLVLGHSRSLFPAEVWNHEWRIKGASLIPLIKTYDQALCSVPSFP